MGGTAVAGGRGQFNTADLILIGGRVRTPAHPSGFTDAIAVTGGVIEAVGSDAGIRDLAGPRTRVVDLRGRLALSAFGDAHVHAINGGLESLRCNMLGLKTRQDCLERIARYCADLPRDGWVLGGGWSMEAFPGGTPTAADLDAVTGGRPAFLPNRDHHGAWVNTVALERAGVDAGTRDPVDGRIERYPDGSPAGTLHDGAMRLVARQVPPATDAELRAGLAAALKYLHSLGIAHYQDACVGTAGELGISDTYRTYLAAAADGTLTADVTGALWWDRHRGAGQIDDLLGRRELTRGEEHSAGRFRATSVKLMLDGVCETFTAAMSTPYLDSHGHETDHHGNFFIDPEELKSIAGRLAAEGFQLHFHALGDGAVTAGLDALETLPAAARAAARHHLAHLQFIKPSDMSRFAALDAVANFQPLWAMADPQMLELTLPFVGPERYGWQYQIGGLARLGTRLAFGSDWPVSSADPLQEMHVAVNRVLSRVLGRAGTPECEEPFLPDQAVTADVAIRAFTEGVAYVNHSEDVTGRLLPGMRADVVVLDQDLYAIPAADIGNTSAVLTVANGQVVHGDE
ncbi:MAG: amidohydrolase [Streptosporangiaceae bacterium]|nr:amidohydrolase [Streptosporangiaceae bacterium]